MTQRLVHAVLLFALVAGQAVAAWHGIDHLGAPADQVCAQCLHQPLQKHALAPAVPDIEVAGRQPQVTRPLKADSRSEPRFFHAARAPPSASC